MPISELTATLQHKEYWTSDVMYLSFQVADTFTFQAGQFVIFTIPCEGKQRPKSYSILNPPTERGKIDLCVKIIPGGIASEAFKAAHPGDTFRVKGPFGHFVFDAKAEEHWFLGAGTGVAPLYSMIKEYLPGIKDTKFVLLFGVRSKKDLFFTEDLFALSEEFPNFKYIPALSEPKPQDNWHGEIGLITQVVEKMMHEGHNSEAYLCGPPPMIDASIKVLTKKGVKEIHIYYDKF